MFTTILSGNVSKDPVFKELPNNTKVCNFSVAINEYRVQNGEKIKETTWISVAAWNDLADVCNRFVHKGDFIIIRGKIGIDQYTNNNNVSVATLKLTAHEVSFGPKQQNNNAETSNNPEEEITF